MGKPGGGRGRGKAGPGAWDDQQRASHLQKLREREAGREIFVRPLPLEATQEDVHEIISRMGGDDGFAIDRVKLVKTGGGTLLSAFVTMSSEEEALRCSSRLNGAKFRGQVLAASLARNREGAGRVKEPCMFFLEGKCNRGDSCQYSHETGTGAGNAARSSTSWSGRRLPPCRFFASGGCSRGENCKFSHETKEESLDARQNNEDKPLSQSKSEAEADVLAVDAEPKETVKRKKKVKAQDKTLPKEEVDEEEPIATDIVEKSNKKKKKLIVCEDEGLQVEQSEEANSLTLVPKKKKKRQNTESQEVHRTDVPATLSVSRKKKQRKQEAVSAADSGLASEEKAQTSVLKAAKKRKSKGISQAEAGEEAEAELTAPVSKGKKLKKKLGAGSTKKLKRKAQ